MVAGHSLGEFSALVAAKAMSFEDGLVLVSKRAMAMQKACELKPSTMAAVLGMDAKTIEDICEATEGVVVAANYNCNGQIVISGSVRPEMVCQPERAKFRAVCRWSQHQAACVGKSRTNWLRRHRRLSRNGSNAHRQ